MIGGYEDGEELRPADQAEVLAMWDKVKRYIAREYAGYPVNIAEHLPDRPVVTTAEGAFAEGGSISVGLKNATNRASLYSTLLHEGKHAIDHNSHAVVEGSAREGAAKTVEEDVWPAFIGEAMRDQADKLPFVRLLTGIDGVRFTATTDATLQIYLRASCTDKEGDTIDFVKQIVAGYGYTEPAVLTRASRRAHYGTQYLQYDYGAVAYRGLLQYLQKGIGSAARVDAFVLQACGMPAPNQDQAAVQKLSECVKARQQKTRSSDSNPSS